MSTRLARAIHRARQDHPNRCAAIDEMTGGGQPATTIVARPDGDDHASAAEIAADLCADELGKVRPGLLDHLEEVDPELVDGEAIDLRHLGRRHGRD